MTCLLTPAERDLLTSVGVHVAADGTVDAAVLHDLNKRLLAEVEARIDAMPVLIQMRQRLRARVAQGDRG